MIKPTIGRVVLFHPNHSDYGVAKYQDAHGNAVTHAAIIAHVWSDTCVNLTVFDSNGAPYSKTSVQLIQGDEPRVDERGYATWMQYQLGQAAKTEIVQAELAKANGVILPGHTAGV